MKRDKRIVFFGTPDFAVASLSAIIADGYHVVGVVTSPDRMGGRGRRQVIESAVKKYAISHDIPILQPTNLKNGLFVEALGSWQADIQVVVAFRMLPVVVWDMPPLGTYNLHGSLLPAYRGAAPINWAVINGEEQTGVTTFKLKHEIDTGSIALQEVVKINRNDHVGDVHDRMMLIGAQLLVKTLKEVFAGRLTLYEQDHTKVSKAPKIYHKDCILDFEQSPFALYNLVRGLSPYPLAWTTLFNIETKVYAASYTFDVHSYAHGTIASDYRTYLAIACQGGWLFLEEIKPAGKGKMKIKDYLNGLRLTPNMSVYIPSTELLS